MTDDWKYGDVVRREITKNPTQYQRVMFVGPARLSPSGRLSMTTFVGIQLSDTPAPAVGAWINPPNIGSLRQRLNRDLFEKAPDDE